MDPITVLVSSLAAIIIKAMELQSFKQQGIDVPQEKIDALFAEVKGLDTAWDAAAVHDKPVTE